ncbi:MAG: hypothetical protein PHP08_00290 [Candidatus Dojkabacteria bacterium]|nr:hypothetical protein [Candidatus Dojkabacteria bacterium]
MRREKPSKKERVKIDRVRMEDHKLSYLFKNYSEELKDKIDHVEIESIQGAILSHVYFKQLSDSNKPPNPRQPKQKEISEESIKKDNSAHDTN